MDKTILNTFFARSYNLNIMAKSCAIDLQTIKLDMEQVEYIKLINSISPVVKSSISEMFLRVKETSILDDYYLISLLKNGKANIPELLSINDVIINGADIPYKKDDKLNKMWVNLTPYVALSKNDRYGDLHISSINEVMSVVVKAFLYKKYQDIKDGWLSPSISEFVINVYIKMMGTIIGRLYGLDLEEGQITKFAFAYYYATKMGDKDNNGIPKLIFKCREMLRYGGVGFDELIKRMDNIVAKDTMTMNHVAQFIVTYGPDRIKKFNSETIYRMLMNSSRNSITSLIAVDFPPYFVYLILRVTSGDKHPLLTNVLNKQFERSQVNNDIKAIINSRELYK